MIRKTASEQDALSLDRQYVAFLNNRFIAMPIAGMIAWSVIAIAGLVLPLVYAVWVLFIGTGMIFYVALVVARFTGEDLLGRERKGNLFDRIYLMVLASSVLVFSIAIPFFLIDPTTLPLSVGVLLGLMWMPFSALIRHWVGYFHGLTRTVLVLGAWYLFPDQRFVAIPIVIVAIYLVTIYILERRFRQLDVRNFGNFSV